MDPYWFATIIPRSEVRLFPLGRIGQCSRLAPSGPWFDSLHSQEFFSWCCWDLLTELLRTVDRDLVMSMEPNKYWLVASYCYKKTCSLFLQASEQSSPSDIHRCFAFPPLSLNKSSNQNNGSMKKSHSFLQHDSFQCKPMQVCAPLLGSTLVLLSLTDWPTFWLAPSSTSFVPRQAFRLLVALT